MGVEGVGYLTAATTTDPGGVVPTHSGAPDNDQDYSYTVDISPGETITTTGTITATTATTPSFVAPFNNANGLFGDWSIDTVGTSTTFTHVFDYDDWVASGFDPQFQTSAAVFEAGGADLDVITLNITCFAAGTRIATPEGTAAVETLRIGDLVHTGAGRAVPVKWIGVQTVSTLFGPAERLRPVRVQAGALGDGLPLHDLTLTADHALLIDGLLINAGALVNGGSIDYVPLAELGEGYKVYHIETEEHEIILAEGSPAETYIDYAARRVFDNYAEYVALYGEDRSIPEMAYPRVSSARMLPPAIRGQLATPRAA